MVDKRTLRIFCPTHEAAFEVAEGPKILCEITEHALSVGFPIAEFWEFCCNCETFTPSRLDKGEKARAVCYGCGNDVSKRFVCANCKTASFECGAQTKGKRYSINADGIEPACPGCRSVSENDALVVHKCKEIGASTLTARADCPFCLERTDAGGERAKDARAASARQACPNCGAARIPGANFCGKCRHQLQADVAVTNLGSDVNRTQLLGSLCPNCSTPITPGSSFCGACGQAVKKATPQAEQPTPIKIPDEKPGVIPAVNPPPNNGTRNAIIGVGIVLFLVGIAAIILNARKSPDGPTYNTNVGSTTTRNTNSSIPDSFRHDYRGTIGEQEFSMSLNRAGRVLTGRASTSSNTDTLSGTIETDGRFRAGGYEGGTRLTGMYTGQVHSDGSVTGNWTTPAGTKETPFYLSQR